MGLVEKATAFARIAHQDKKYGNQPYMSHVEQVVETLDIYYSSPPKYVIAATYLHDVIEDTSCDFAQTLRMFGYNVARLAFAVTNEPGKNRKERFERTYPKILAAGEYAIAIKLADRIANVQNCLANNPKLLQMYKKEYRLFREWLYVEDLTSLQDMWDRLDDLLKWSSK